MGKEIITFGDIEIEKHKFWQHKNAISIRDINIDRTVVSSKAPFGKKGFKDFIGYENDDEKVMLLCTILPKTCAYTKYFDEPKYMSSPIKDNKLLEKYNKIWDKSQQD